MKKIRYHATNMDTLFMIFAFGFTFLIFIMIRAFSPNDDILFLKSFDQNTWLGISDALTSGGRFVPFSGLDFYITELFTGNAMDKNIAVYYGINAVTFLGTVIFLQKTIKKMGTYPWVYACAILIIISPAFTSVHFRMEYLEHYVIFFFAIIIYGYTRELTRGNTIMIMTASFFAICSKEISFMPIATISILQYFSSKDEKHKKLAKKLFAASIVFLLCYLVIVFPHIKARYGKNGMGYVENTVKAFVEWGLGDPFLLLVLFPAMAYEAYRIRIAKTSSLNMYSIFGFAGMAYCMPFSFLKMAYAPQYWTPAYAFALPALIFLLFKQEYRKKLFFRLMIPIAFFIQVGNLTIGINDMIFQKFNNKNFSEIINSCNSIIEENSINGKRVNFFALAGKDWCNGWSDAFIYFLEKKGNKCNQFDVMSYEKVTDTVAAQATASDLKYKPRYTCKDPRINPEPHTGDYILVTPYTKKQYQDSLPDGVVLIKKWNAPIFLPNLNWKDRVRDLACYLNIMGNSLRNKKTGVMRAQYALYKMK